MSSLDTCTNLSFYYAEFLELKYFHSEEHIKDITCRHVAISSDVISSNAIVLNTTTFLQSDLVTLYLTSWCVVF